MDSTASMIMSGVLLAAAAPGLAKQPASSAAAPAAPVTSAANAATKPSGPEASIPFANHGGIWTWQVVNNSTLLIQSQNRKWYRATLMNSCFDLPFAETIGFETNPDGTFDKFGSIKVRDQRCPVVSLVETAAPEKKSNTRRKIPTPPTPGATTR